jgi:hypothetical protein
MRPIVDAATAGVTPAPGLTGTLYLARDPAPVGVLEGDRLDVPVADLDRPESGDPLELGRLGDLDLEGSPAFVLPQGEGTGVPVLRRSRVAFALLSPAQAAVKS